MQVIWKAKDVSTKLELQDELGGCTMQAAASVLELFPPRGIIRLLPPEHTELGRLKMERLVAEEYILDTIHFFEADRVECAKRLAKGTACLMRLVMGTSIIIVLLFQGWNL